MRPGQMFTVSDWWSLAYPQREAWVVVDQKTEVGFWSGARAAIGDVAPSMFFEVIT